MIESTLNYLNSFGKGYDFNFLQKEFKDDYEDIEFTKVAGKQVLFDTGSSNGVMYTGPGNLGEYIKVDKELIQGRLKKDSMLIRVIDERFVVVSENWSTIKPYNRLREYYLSKWGMYYYQEYTLRKVRGEKEYTFKLTMEILEDIGGTCYYREINEDWHASTMEELEYNSRINPDKIDAQTGLSKLYPENAQESEFKILLESIHNFDHYNSWIKLGGRKKLCGFLEKDDQMSSALRYSSKKFAILVKRNSDIGLRIFEWIATTRRVPRTNDNAIYNTGSVYLRRGYKINEIARVLIDDTGIHGFQKNNGTVVKLTFDELSIMFKDAHSLNGKLLIPEYINEGFSEYDYSYELDIEELNFKEEINNDNSVIYKLTSLRFFKELLQKLVIEDDYERTNIIKLLNKFQTANHTEWFIHHESKYTLSSFMLNRDTLQEYLVMRYGVYNQEAENYYELVGLNNYQLKRLSECHSSVILDGLVKTIRLILSRGNETEDIRHVDNTSFDKVVRLISRVSSIATEVINDQLRWGNPIINDIFNNLIALNVSLDKLINNIETILDILTSSGEFANEDPCKTEYRDYLNMLSYFDRDVKSTFNIFPKDLEELVVSHDNITCLYKEKEASLKESKFSNIKYKYKGFEYNDDKYIVKSPEKLAEIVLEGNTLKHCVSSYTTRVADGETSIMFIRKKDCPDKSLYTVEITPKKDIVQVKGFRNTVPDEDVKSFIEKWSREKKLNYRRNY